MKKYLLILFCVVFIWGCGEKIEVIPNYDEEFISLEKNDLPVQMINENGQSKSIPFEVYLEELLSESPLKIQDNLNEIRYRLYINRNGKIEKVKLLNGQPEQVDYDNLKKMENWKFTSAILGGKPQKFRYDLFLKKNSKDNKVSLYTAVVNNIERPDEGEYAVSVEIMPIIVGGLESIMKKIKYPEDAKKQGIEGRVFVRAFIDEYGKVTFAEVLRGINSSCDSAALYAVKNTSFTPAKQNGKNVKVQVSIPILFKLQ